MRLSASRRWRRICEPRGAIRRGALFVFLVFGAFDLANSWQAFAGSGEIRATHGRYFFVLLAFLPIAFVPPPSELRRERVSRAALLITAALAADQALFFLFG